MRYYSAFIIFFILIAEVSQSSAVSGGEVNRVGAALFEHIFEKYSKLERPVENESDALVVRISSSLIFLLEVNIQKEAIATNLWLRLEWTDYNFAWNSEYFEGIEEITIPAYRIWRPDIQLYNFYREPDLGLGSDVKVTKNGKMVWLVPGIYMSQCKLDVTNYPFDSHDCRLKFGSWTTHGETILLEMNDTTVDISQVQNIGVEWSVIEMFGELDKKFYPCCDEAYIDAIYTIRIQRNGGLIFFGASAILLIAAASVLFSLCLPVNTSHRIYLGILTVLALWYTAISLDNRIGGHGSILVHYFWTLTGISLSSTVLQGILSYYNEQSPSDHHMHPIVQKFVVNKLARLLHLSKSSSKTYTISSSGLQGTKDNLKKIRSEIQKSVSKAKGNEFYSKPIHHLNEWETLALILNTFALFSYSFILTVFFMAYLCHFTAINL